MARRTAISAWWRIVGWVRGEINDTQPVAWRQTLEVFGEAEQRARTLSLFPEDRDIPADALDGVQVKRAEMELRRLPGGH